MSDRTKRKITTVCALGLAAIAAWACSEKPGQRERNLVAVSVLPQAYFVERIARDSVDIEVMIPKGGDPHTYEPTMKQMEAVSKASLYVKVGHPAFDFEKAWLDKLLSHRKGLEVIDGSAGIESRQGDPHVWVSPKCVRAMARNIAAALVRLMPDRRAEFSRNLGEFTSEIDLLDARIKKSLAGVKRRRFYVVHPAWGTFASEYGLEQVAIERGHVEPSVGEVMEIISLSKKDGAGAIFTTPQASDEPAKLFARETGGRVVTVDPLDRDWLKNMRTVSDAIFEELSR